MAHHILVLRAVLTVPLASACILLGACQTERPFTAVYGSETLSQAAVHRALKECDYDLLKLQQANPVEAEPIPVELTMKMCMESKGASYIAKQYTNPDGTVTRVKPDI
jgi:hypothetical protein